MSGKKFGYVYQITNSSNSKSYIGKTTQNIEKYINNHFKAQDKKKVLHRAIRKYGKENFTWKILWSGNATNDHLNNLEIFFIAYYNTNLRNNGYGYNLSSGGDGGILYTIHNVSKEKRKINGIKIANIRKNNGTYLTGQSHQCSKTNMSKEKRIEKAYKMVAVREKRNNTNNGCKNGRAKKYLLISPKNKHYMTHGNLEKFCIKNKLNFAKIFANINKSKIKSWKFQKNTSQHTKNCVGWKIKLI